MNLELGPLGPLTPQWTVTGQRPSFVFDPTFHRHVIRPPIFALKPAALVGPVE